MRTICKPGKPSGESPAAIICAVSSSKHSRWRRKTSVTSAAMGLSRNTGSEGKPAAPLQRPRWKISSWARSMAKVGITTLPPAATVLRITLPTAIRRRRSSVVAVAVGRFHDDVVGLGEDARVAEDGLVPLADVAGEDQPPRAAVGPQVDLDHRRAEDVAGVVEDGRHAVLHLDRIVVRHASKSGSVRSTSLSVYSGLTGCCPSRPSLRCRFCLKAASSA